MRTRIILHNFVVFVAKNFWVFISYIVHRNKLIDIFINNINRVINKNLSLFFFPSDIKLAWKAKQKQRELAKNQLFFISLLFFFLKIQDIRKSKTPIFERGSHKKFLVKCLPFFKLAPICKPFYNRSVNSKAFKYTIITLKLKIYFSWKSWKHNFVCKLFLHFSHTFWEFFLHKTHFLTGPGAR